jgi:hypothetical protein
MLEPNAYCTYVKKSFSPQLLELFAAQVGSRMAERKREVRREELQQLSSLLSTLQMKGDNLPSFQQAKVHVDSDHTVGTEVDKSYIPVTAPRCKKLDEP